MRTIINEARSFFGEVFLMVLMIFLLASMGGCDPETPFSDPAICYPGLHPGEVICSFSGCEFDGMEMVCPGLCNEDFVFVAPEGGAR